jgi:hypothetical protein
MHCIAVDERKSYLHEWSVRKGTPKESFDEASARRRSKITPAFKRTGRPAALRRGSLSTGAHYHSKLKIKSVPTLPMFGLTPVRKLRCCRLSITRS